MKQVFPDTSIKRRIKYAFVLTEEESMNRRFRKISAALVGACILTASVFSAYAAEAQVDIDITWEDMFGPQDGVLTVDEAAGEWSLFFANPYGEHTVSGVFAQDGTMECTNDNGEGQFLPMEAIAQVAEPAIRALLTGEEAAAASDAVAEEAAAEEAADDFEDFTEIISWDVLDYPTVFEKLPDAYNTYDTEYKGSQIYIDYTTDVYEDGVTYDKFARVYLPYGYDPEDTETKYNVIYLQHGNSNTPSTFFDIVIPKANFVNLMDNLFDPEHGLMDPCIVVCPTYYLDIEKETVGVLDDQAIAGDGRYAGLPGNYYKEVIEDLIPAVESQLNVYCEDFSPEGIAATRDHRAWAGFSRGSVCTWYMFHNAFEYFRYWMPTSAQCMPDNVVLGDPNAQEWNDEAAYQYLKETIDANPELPFFIIAQSGGPEDAASMRVQMKYLIGKTDTFSYGMNPEENNFYYTCSDFTHDQLLMPYYFYTARNILFR